MGYNPEKPSNRMPAGGLRAEAAVATGTRVPLAPGLCPGVRGRTDLLVDAQKGNSLQG